jgi:hypothetical protein
MASRGQSMVELVILLSALSLFMTAVVLLGSVGDSGVRTSLAARLAAFDCDTRPGFCRGDAQETQQQMQNGYLSGKFRDHLQKPSDITLTIDMPRVDGADKSLLSKLADAFRGFGLKAGPLIFGLPSPDQLTRSTVETVLWRSNAQLSSGIQMPPLRQVSKVAMISDSWSADGAQQFLSRVRTGEHPAQLLTSAASIAYFPAKDLLMPVMDAVGLESNTQAFRGAFHDVNTDAPYSNARVRIR